MRVKICIHMYCKSRSAATNKQRSACGLSAHTRALQKSNANESKLNLHMYITKRENAYVCEYERLYV